MGGIVGICFMFTCFMSMRSMFVYVLYAVFGVEGRGAVECQEYDVHEKMLLYCSGRT